MINLLRQIWCSWRTFLVKVWKWSGVLLFFFSTYLYVYLFWFPISHPQPKDPNAFRFALFGDPQMEGDSRIRRQGKYLGNLNIWINDVYGRHIVDNVISFVQPSISFVLGDLFSSQNLNNPEFDIRLNRYRWIFGKLCGGDPLCQGEDGVPRLFNITGNHDIGYAFEVSESKVKRWEEGFGPVNQIWKYKGHTLAILNSMNMDTSKDQKLQNQTWEYLHNLSDWRYQNLKKPLLLFFHVPLHKPVGSCVDNPHTSVAKGGYVTQQNMLTPETSKFILENLRPQAIFTGHDHYGCSYVHTAENGDQIPEFTIRSVMGDFGGATAVVDVTPLPPFKKTMGDGPSPPHATHFNEQAILGQGDFEIQYEYSLWLVSFVLVHVAVADLVLILIWIALGIVLAFLNLSFHRTAKLHQD